MQLVTLLGLLSAACPFVYAVDLEQYRIKAAPEYTNGRDAATAFAKTNSLKSGNDYIETAKKLVKSVAPDAEFYMIDDYFISTGGIGHVNFKQTADGLDIDNAVFNVNIGKDGNVLSYGNSFVEQKTSSLVRSEKVNAITALKIAREKLALPITVDSDAKQEGSVEKLIEIKGVSGAESDPTAKLVYFAKPNGDLILAWKIDTDVEETSFSSFVNAQDKNDELLAIHNHVKQATYQVYPFGLNDPREGEREVVEDPENLEVSKDGWIDPTFNGGGLTYGNNAQAGGVLRDGLVRFAESQELNFSFPYTPDEVDPTETMNAAVTNIFYTVNMLHDLYYVLGWTPAAGNLQKDNGDEGGKGNDAVYITVQYWGERNNGYMRQTPDGIQPSMNMLLFDSTDPMRDSAFDNGFVIHEYTHGLSDRLTGGPETRGCLESWEADGMAEGWSDLYAAALTIKPEEDRDTATYGFAAWPLDKTDPPTARLVMYSTDMEVNDWTYEKSNELERVHEVGTVWATMLYEVLWNLIDKHGKEDGPSPELVDGVPTDGKYLMLKILLEAFSIQPCNPSFVQARDAILDADLELTGGDNTCEIWKGFAKRGLGVDAVSNDSKSVKENFDLPDGVC